MLSLEIKLQSIRSNIMEVTRAKYVYACGITCLKKRVSVNKCVTFVTWLYIFTTVYTRSTEKSVLKF